MSLTIAEKSHWKERIGKRIDQRIEMLVARENPILLQNVAEQSRARAYDSLGIQSEQVELDALEEQKKESERRERRSQAGRAGCLPRRPGLSEWEMDRGLVAAGRPRQDVVRGLPLAYRRGPRRQLRLGVPLHDEGPARPRQQGPVR